MLWLFQKSCAYIYHILESLERHAHILCACLGNERTFLPNLVVKGGFGGQLLTATMSCLFFHSILDAPQISTTLLIICFVRTPMCRTHSQTHISGLLLSGFALIRNALNPSMFELQFVKPTTHWSQFGHRRSIIWIEACIWFFRLSVLDCLCKRGHHTSISPPGLLGCPARNMGSTSWAPGSSALAQAQFSCDEAHCMKQSAQSGGKGICYLIDSENN